MKRFGYVALLVGTALWSSPAMSQEEPAADAATEIVGRMQLAVGKLTKLDTGKPTQTTQKQIVEKLDDLIAQLEKECENCRGGRAGANPSKPAADSMIKSGPGGSGDLHAARKEGKNWGELPPHERDRILQSMTEGFPPHYQRILEKYYKRLAQETPVDAGDSPASNESPAASGDAKPAVKPVAKPIESKTAPAADAKPAAGANPALAPTGESKP